MFSRPIISYRIKVSILKTHDQAFIKKYVTETACCPKKAGMIMPGRNKSMKTVNTRNTQILYREERILLIRFKALVVE